MIEDDDDSTSTSEREQREMCKVDARPRISRMTCRRCMGPTAAPSVFA